MRFYFTVVLYHVYESLCLLILFSSSNCGWNDTSTGSYEFVQSTGASAKGPSTDHTSFSKTGKYMLVDTKRGASGYKLAMLTSPTLRNAGVDCTLRFW